MTNKVLTYLSEKGIDLDPDFLEHAGVKGMKWGVRNEDTNGDGKVDQGSKSSSSSSSSSSGGGSKKNIKTDGHKPEAESGAGGGGGGDLEALEEELDEDEKEFLDKLVGLHWTEAVDEDGRLYVIADKVYGPGVAATMSRALTNGYMITPGQNKIYMERSDISVENQNSPSNKVNRFLTDLFNRD